MANVETTYPSFTRAECFQVQQELIDALGQEAEVEVVVKPNRPIHLTVKTRALGRLHLYVAKRYDVPEQQSPHPYNPIDSLIISKVYFRVSIGVDDANVSNARGRPNAAGIIIDMHNHVVNKISTYLRDQVVSYDE